MSYRVDQYHPNLASQMLPWFGNRKLLPGTQPVIVIGVQFFWQSSSFMSISFTSYEIVLHGCVHTWLRTTWVSQSRVPWRVGK